MFRGAVHRAIWHGQGGCLALCVWGFKNTSTKIKKSKQAQRFKSLKYKYTSLPQELWWEQNSSWLYMHKLPPPSHCLSLSHSFYPSSLSHTHILTLILTSTVTHWLPLIFFLMCCGSLDLQLWDIWNSHLFKQLFSILASDRHFLFLTITVFSQNQTQQCLDKGLV